jgi:adenosine deaminase
MGRDGWTFGGPLDFIDNYLELCQLFGTLDDFRRLAVEVCQDLAATGVRYAEVVFSPGNHARRLDGDWFGPIEAVLDGLAAGERDLGVRVRVCPDIVRDNGLDDAQRTLEVALRHAGSGVVALNCAGSERTGVQQFASMFRKAARAGLKSVPHAGEWAGPDNVRATIEHLRPDRIGHGVRAIEDAALVVELADRQIPLEVCPVSNVATGVYERIDDVPLLTLRDAGVPVTLNSDDPAMFGGWLADVYAAARDAWALSDDDLAGFARTAVDVSFADDDRKAALRTEIDAWLATPVASAEAPAIP